MITDVAGVRVGHWTDPVARTGCTVVLLPAGTVASGEVRGGAPGTREWALLEPGRLVDRVDAVVLAGGSAFGLAACDGVVRWCEERGIGWPTSSGPVPIVVGMVIYDLSVGDPSVRPGADDGYRACVDARAAGAMGHGRVGAATGATISKWRGPDAARAGGLGSAAARRDRLVVAALMVVNSLGDRPDPGGPPRLWGRAPVMTNTTIGLVVTNARLDKVGCRAVASSAHDGLARAVDPVHTEADGDAVVTAATGQIDAAPGEVRALAAWVVERAVRSVLEASSGPP